ncbi:excalibur calcium-binding domain-containing protein [Metabacillus sp. GX 13764]|uniref:excalibur calcium-binding domain-containing protein n=1 Tax=Metabacillus kandeliae TaxID=2900151 RepID=UPI001E28CA8B|nr:excalibur calcium-binding domain-containing protein [Metabacillus kandeliae]MCD7034171.1 excalibur calcium-binding domain-containing protein [Metabacillus kandeliae]
MKKATSIALSFVLVTGFCFNVQPVEAKTKIKAYASCKLMNAVYKGGIAISSKAKNKGGKLHYKQYVSKELYLKNTARDRDHDGLACER